MKTKTSLLQGFLVLAVAFVGPYIGCGQFFGSPYESGLTPVATESEITSPAVETSDLGATPIPQFPTLYVEAIKDEGIPLVVCTGFLEEGYIVGFDIDRNDDDVLVYARAICVGQNYISVTPAEDYDIIVSKMYMQLKDGEVKMEWEVPMTINSSILHNGDWSYRNRISNNLSTLLIVVEP